MQHTGVILVSLVDRLAGGVNSATILVDKYEEASEITCICCAELELERTRIELRSTHKIELQRENSVRGALCANACSSEVRRPSGLHQLNEVLK
jgi:hypothetical protein